MAVAVAASRQEAVPVEEKVVATEEVVVVKEAGEEDADEGDDFYEGRQHCSTACARALPLFDMHVARRWGGE